MWDRHVILTRQHRDYNPTGLTDAMKKNLLPLLCLGSLLFSVVPARAEPAAPPQMTLTLLKTRLAVAQLPAIARIPGWTKRCDSFVSITRTASELSIVCPQAVIPPKLKQETGYRIVRVEGQLDFALVGILASITAPLAQAGVSIFTVSTYDTDYVMFKDDKREPALAALRAAGHTVRIEE